MATFKDLKQRFMDYLATMDFDKMDMGTIQSYAYVLKTIDEMEKPGYAESIALAFGGKMMEQEAKTNV